MRITYNGQEWDDWHLRDIIHHLLRRQPLYPDVKLCGRRFCRFCGGRNRKQ